MKRFSVKAFVLSIGWMLLALAGRAEEGGETWKRIAPLFTVPAEFSGQYGPYRSPLKFYDGRPVAAPAEWPARRQEILDYWHGVMGPWPRLLARPRFERAEGLRRENFTQQRVKIEISPGFIQSGILLVPDGKGPFPAVLVVYYDPATSVGLPSEFVRPFTAEQARLRDFAREFTRRGYVTLSIGPPGGDGRTPDLNGAKCQPLSYHAYMAANCHTALAQLAEVDPKRIGVMGHSYGGKWAMFASCLYDKFACAAWSDGGVVFDEQRGSINYWDSFYLGWEGGSFRPRRGLVSGDNPRLGAYKRLVEEGHDLHELHALMAPRPFLVSGGSEDYPARWRVLNHAIAVNQFLGYTNRVAMHNRPAHSPTAESNEIIYDFFGFFLK